MSWRDVLEMAALYLILIACAGAWCLDAEFIASPLEQWEFIEQNLLNQTEGFLYGDALNED